MLCDLLNNKENREIKFFEVYNLLNAVLTTQATNINPKNIEELKTYKFDIQNNLYSELEVIKNLMTSKRIVKFDQIEQLIKLNKSITYDYRIINYLFLNLNCRNNDLLKFIRDCLIECNNIQLVEILKENFDINNKVDMTYKLEVISKIAKEKENDFYLYLFNNAKNSFLPQVIKALGYSKENKELLMNLFNEKKFKHKNEIVYALGNIEDKEVKQFIKNILFVNKNYNEEKENIYKYFSIFLDLQNNMLDEIYFETLEYLLKEDENFTDNLLFLLIFTDNLNKLKNYIFKYINCENCHINIILSELLVYNIIKTDDNKFLDLGKEVFKQDKYNYYKTTAFLISLLTKPAKEVFEKFSEEVFPDENINVENSNIFYKEQRENLQTLFFSIALNKNFWTSNINNCYLDCNNDKNVIAIQIKQSYFKYYKDYEKIFFKQLYENLHIDWFKMLYNEKRVLINLYYKEAFYVVKNSYSSFHILEFLLNNFSKDYTIIHNYLKDLLYKYLTLTNNYKFYFIFKNCLEVLCYLGIRNFDGLFKKFLLNDTLNDYSFKAFKLNFKDMQKFTSKENLIKEIIEVREIIKQDTSEKASEDLKKFDYYFYNRIKHKID